MTDAKPDIIEILEREGVELRQRGRHFWGLCPFHADKHPSFRVDTQRQRFRCFGCQASGDVVDFVQQLHNLTFKDALRYLGIEPGKPPQVDPKEKRKRELVRGFEAWRRRTYRDLCDSYNDRWHVLRSCRDMEEISEHAPAIHEMSMMQHHIEILTQGTDDERFELYRASI